MKDLLLDTNIIAVYLTGARRADPRHPRVRDRFDNAGRRKFFIPIMSVLEIESGLAMGERTVPLSETITKEIAHIRGFISRYAKININADMVPYYAQIRAKVFELNGVKNTSGRGYKAKKTHELMARSSDVSLGIDERDLLIVATSLQRNLALATLDSNGEMKKILEAARCLESEGRLPHLDVEAWDLPVQ